MGKDCRSWVDGVLPRVSLFDVEALIGVGIHKVLWKFLFKVDGAVKVEGFLGEFENHFGIFEVGMLKGFWVILFLL